MQRLAGRGAVVAKYATTLLATVALFAMVAGCAPRYIPVHHYQEVERVKVERDSIHYTDTVRIAERGDTVLMEVVKWRTRYKTKTDTLIRVDTVQLPPEIVAPAPAKSWTDKWWAGFVFVALSLAIGAVSLYLLGKVFKSELGV